MQTLYIKSTHRLLAPAQECIKERPMIKYGELHQALARYTNTDIHEDIPLDYSRRVVKAWYTANNKGLSWDVQQAATVLLYIAFNEGVIHSGQINTDGLKALEWAEKFLAQIKASATEKTNENNEVLDALKSA
jgi:hypothetical protein